MHEPLASHMTWWLVVDSSLQSPNSVSSPRRVGVDRWLGNVLSSVAVLPSRSLYRTTICSMLGP
jgi:hypothetical protein